MQRAPTVVSNYHAQVPDGMPGGAWLAGIGFFVLLGGAWNIALKGHEPWLGLYHGATAPLVLQFLAHAM